MGDIGFGIPPDDQGNADLLAAMPPTGELCTLVITGFMHSLGSPRPWNLLVGCPFQPTPVSRPSLTPVVDLSIQPLPLLDETERDIEVCRSFCSGQK